LRSGRATRSDAKSFAAYDAYAWTACAALAIVPLATRTYGDSRLGRCHVVHGDEGESARAGTAKVVRFATYYAPVWTAFAYNAYCWWAIRRGLSHVRALEATLGNDASARRATARLRTFVQRLSLYPITQVATNVPGTVLRLSTLLGRSKPGLGLVCLHIAFKTSQGLLHAIVFFVSHPARREMVIELARNFGCARFLPVTWGVGVEDAQTGGLGDLADDIDLMDENDDDDDPQIARDGFVLLTRTTKDDEDEDAASSGTVAVEMSAFIGQREERSDAPSS
jgi:hypothetical protein